ncbi:MAG: tRNA pseudouridine(38-40) synthase TruA [Pseudomonadales bacterium]|nr:tRNA pseudouridine(38-40) synthase TruA [Pseudomonadales bacterium]MBI28136.1 tRNA pseudouridine(38-40) synthase TruA [Pseudomonadales bacterium]MEC8811018.1 tRNA pseudouridine(38-40) synthase TruA [Pseudomonadota bacterium]|tara:strand:- start:47307 stop:48110 length:804 start_codon:yes stop_codon:yes gene_type:complete
MRVALGVEYDGSHYCGWQRQKHDPDSVQEHLERALAKVADHPTQVICAGRTDTGVHGVGQVVHFDTRSHRPEKGWVFGSNRNLPDSISVRWAKPVADDFHARFSALSRAYRYVIYNHPVRPALGMQHLTWNYRPLDVALMQQAADVLVGEHDFSSFQAQGCQAKSPVRTIHHIKLRRHGHLIVMDIQANAFLQHMVRNIAGVLMAIGCGKEPLQWVNQVLDHRNRALGGVTAPPFGLFFMRVGYPEEFGIPEPERDIPFMPLADTLS